MILLSRRSVLLSLASLGLTARPASALGDSTAAGVGAECSAPSPPRRLSLDGLDPNDDAQAAPPYVPPRELIDGRVLDVDLDDETTPSAETYGCCFLAAAPPGSPSEGANAAEDGECAADYRLLPARLGRVPQMTTAQSLSVLDSAAAAWHGGSGSWPQMTLAARIAAVETFVAELGKVREEAVKVLMWEIGKNRLDAEAEFDRTVGFVKQIIDVLRSPSSSEYNSEWLTIGSTRAFVRRGPMGIVLCLGPYNYPLNETYATLIPALLMGNIIVMKIPTVGGLVHMLTMDAFAKALPPGTINFISGSGRATMPPLMETGKIDVLAFIGGSSAADDLIRKHPEPHRLKTFLQLEAKNMGVFLPDLFDGDDEDRVGAAVGEAVTGALSFNGQRCTAIKIIFAPASHASRVAEEVAARVDAMRIGLPWQTFESEGGETTPLYANITPLPNQRRVEHMRRLIDDATSKGARVMNEDGGAVIGGEGSTLMIPAVLFPTTPDMDVYDEEQFGPVVPVAAYDDLEAVFAYGREGKYGQQVSLFTGGGGNGEEGGHGRAHELVDAFSAVFGKININGGCGRSPDSLPFSGRRSSAMGVMSVTEALREFSVPTVVAYKERGENERIVTEIQGKSKFMADL